MKHYRPAYVPTSATAVTLPGLAAVVYYYQRGTTCCAIAMPDDGRSCDWHLQFTSATERNRAAGRYLAICADLADTPGLTARWIDSEVKDKHPLWISPDEQRTGRMTGR